MKLNAKQVDECLSIVACSGIKRAQQCSGFIGRITLVLYLMAALILYSEATLAKVPQILSLMSLVIEKHLNAVSF